MDPEPVANIEHGNEITDITETVGASWVTPVYSRAGNMTTMPQPASPASSYTATYDAWNRLVKIADGANTVSEYQYDGAKRRVVQKSYVSGTLNETRHLYYTEPSKWQVVEERVGTSTSANRQFVWGLRYIDDLILRDRDTDGNGTLDERLYSLQDANWNVTGLVNTSGVIQQRFVYTAYGLPVFLNSSFTSGSNTAAWEVLYAGYRFETATSLMHVRHRVLNAALGCWVQRDPIGYADGESLYMYVRANALTATDKSGLFGPVVLGCLGGLIGGGISNLIDYIKGSATGCEAIMATLCSTGIGCIVGALVTALEFDPTWAAFFACAGIGAIVGLLSQLCQAAAHGFCLLFECDAKEMTLSCFLADVIASGLGTGLNCAFPAGGAAAVLAFMLGLDIGLVPSLLC